MKDFIKKNKVLILLFIFSFFIRLITILIVETEITSDFKTMYDASLEMIKGLNSYKDSTYFLTWGYQIGHVLYQSILLSIINSVTFLKIVNCLITSFTVIFIYLLSKKLTSKTPAIIISILYAIFPFPLLLNTVLTNQHLPLLLILIAIYLLSSINYKNKFILKSIIIGLLIGLSNILRSEGIVIICAITIYSLYLIIRKYNLKKVISSLVLIVISYFLIFNITSLLLIKTDISLNGLNNMNPTWKFVLGFNYETNGMYSESDAAIYANDKNKSKEIVEERIREVEKIPLLFLKKIKIQWFNSDLSWSLNTNINRTIYNILNTINQIFIILFNVLAFLSIFTLLKRKDNLQVLITLILLIYFGVYLLIEVMPRYAYSMQIFEAVLASITISFILKKIKNKS